MSIKAKWGEGQFDGEEFDDRDFCVEVDIEHGVKTKQELDYDNGLKAKITFDFNCGLKVKL